jgi:hypothetical protein
MRRATLLGFIILAFVALFAAISGRTTADEADSVEIKKRINWWRNDKVGKQYTKGIDFTSIDKPTQTVVTTPSTGRGYSIHIAVSKLSPTAYDPVDPQPGMYQDLADMKQIATSEGFTVLRDDLVDEKATHRDVIGAITDAQKKVGAGDTLLITYSGHGSQIPDETGEAPMVDIWCLYDDYLISHELRPIWNGFDQNARIIVVLDSCHSSTATRQITPHLTNFAIAKQREARLTLGTYLAGQTVASKALRAHMTRHAALKRQSTPSRLLPMEVAANFYAKNRDALNRRLADLHKRAESTDTTLIKPTVMTLAACKNEETALGGPTNGLFTRYLFSIWNQGRYTKPYNQFLADVGAKVQAEAALTPDDDTQKPHQQHPTYDVYPRPNPAFEGMAPFTLK